MASFEQLHPTERDWYEKAKTKVESFMTDLDPELRVEVARVSVTERSRDRRNVLSLRFYSLRDPALNWTMEINTSDSYIDHELEAVVRRIYQERAQSLGHS